MSSHHGSGQGGLSGTLRSLAGLLALIATVFLAPHVWPLIDAPVWSALSDLYDPTTAAWLHLAGEIATYPLTFLAARLGCIAVFTAITLYLTKRLM